MLGHDICLNSITSCTEMTQGNGTYDDKKCLVATLFEIFRKFPPTDPNLNSGTMCM